MADRVGHELQGPLNYTSSTLTTRPTFLLLDKTTREEFGFWCYSWCELEACQKCYNRLAGTFSLLGILHINSIVSIPLPIFFVIFHRLSSRCVGFNFQQIWTIEKNPGIMALNLRLFNSRPLMTLSKSQNWLVGPWPDQTFWQWDRFSLRDFTEKPFPLYILFMIWLIWMV